MKDRHEKPEGVTYSTEKNWCLRWLLKIKKCHRVNEFTMYKSRKKIIAGNLQRQIKSKGMKTVHKNSMIFKMFYNETQ